MRRNAREFARHGVLAIPLASLCVPALSAAQAAPPDTATPWTGPTQPAPQAVQQPQQPIYLDPYGQPIGPNGGPIYGTNFAPPQYVPEPPRAPIVLRGMIGAQIGVIGYQSSPYRISSRAWGYDAFGDALNVAVDGGVHLHRAFLLGARVAYSNAMGGTATFDNASLNLMSVDFNVIGRVGWPVPLGRHDWMFYPGIQLEVGGLYAATSLRMQTSSALLPRVAGQVALIFADRHFGIGLRLGYQYASWSNAAGSGEELSLAGFMASVGLEVRL